MLYGDGKKEGDALSPYHYISSKAIFNLLFPLATLQRIADDFGDILFNTKDDGISAKFDAAGVVREFVNREFEDLINENIELFLVKFYSGLDPNLTDAVTVRDQNGVGVPSPALMAAARNIYEHLTGRGAPLAMITDQNLLYNMPNRRFITVPKCCPNLMYALKIIAAADWHNAPGIYESDSIDEPVMLSVGSGIPAFAY